jgi:tRNA-modifying protein YgfZ
MHALTSQLDALERASGGVVAVDRPDLATVALTGADVLGYLHAVCSQHTLDLAPGQATQALLLSPKGKIELAFRLAVLDGGVLLDTEAGDAAALAERLARFVFRYDVAVAAPAPGAASLLGPGTDAALAAAGLPVPAPGRAGLAWAETHPGGSGAGRTASTSAGLASVGPDLVVHRTEVGVDLVGPGASAVLAGLERAGVERAPDGLWELVRVERGMPRAGRELTDDVLAEEAGLLGSHVHLDKGCYPGQETVARVHNLGHVQRRLAGLRFRPAGGGGPDGLPEPGTDLVADDGRRAGQLRSVVDHPRLGPIGLAYVRRVVDTGRLVRAGDHVATVVDLPFA